MEEIILYAIYVLAAIITVVGLLYILMLHIFVLISAAIEKIKGR